MKPTKETFLNDVKNHKLEILHEDGIYRHLRFKDPGHTELYFDIITAQGLLLYRGDMGCYEFERLPDMFEFFRQPELKINLKYWSEKLQAGVFENLSSEAFEEQIWKNANEFIKSGQFPSYDIDCFKEEIKDLVSNDYSSYESIPKYSFSTKKTDGEYVTCEDVFGKDTWDWDIYNYTYQFIWCCYAIVWGIAEYDKLKSKQNGNPPEGYQIASPGVIVKEDFIAFEPYHKNGILVKIQTVLDKK